MNTVSQGSGQSLRKKSLNAAMIRRQIMVLMVITFVIELVAWLGWLQPFDNRIYDAVQTSTTVPAGPDIGVLMVDDATLKEGYQPSSRDMHRQMMEALARAGAKALVYSTGFELTIDKSPEENARLMNAALQGPLICLALPGEMPRDPLIGTFLAATPCKGLVIPSLEADGVDRGVMVAPSKAADVPIPISVAASRIAFPGYAGTGFPLGGPVAVEPGYHRLWLGSGHQIFSAGNVIAGKIPPEQLKGKLLVFGVGVSGLGLNAPVAPRKEFKSTAQLIAAEIDALREGRIVTEPQAPWPAMAVVLLGAICILVFRWVSYGTHLLVATGLILGILTATAWTLVNYGVWWAPTALLAMILSTSLATTWIYMRRSEQIVHDELRGMDVRAGKLNLSGYLHSNVARLEEVYELRRQVQLAALQREEMLSFLTHDIKAPFLSVLASMDTMSRDLPQQQFDERVSKLTKSAQWGLNLAEGFQALIRARQMERVDFVEFDLMSLLTEVIDEFWERANARQVEILQLPEFPDGMTVRGNRLQLHRLFSNLLDNALKYGEIGQPISITWRILGNRIRIAIRNQGPVLTDVQAGQLFEKHYRGPSASALNSGGSGLGLLICSHIVDMHDGSIELRRPEPGAYVFEVQLNLQSS